MHAPQQRRCSEPVMMLEHHPPLDRCHASADVSGRPKAGG
jgi:hypothetical protein